MSMDEQYSEMRRFKDELTRFNEHMRASMRDLHVQHERVEPLWQDAMRQTYNAHWQPLDELMKQYLEREGPRYEQFLVDKIRWLGAYLHGH